MSNVTLSLFLMYFQNHALVLSFLIFLALENVISFTKLLFIENEAMELCVTMWKRFTPTLATVWRKSF